MKPTKEQIADKAIDLILQELEEEKRERLKMITPVTPVSQTAQACLIQFPTRMVRCGS